MVSERAIKEALPTVVDVVGDGRCKADQWVLLNGTNEEVKNMKDNLILQRGLLKVQYSYSTVVSSFSLLVL